MDNSKNSMNNDKSLCLYCDKAFSNINDQGNHVERDHKTVLNKSKGSLRKSERITKNLCSENSPFAACFYCNNKKLIKSDDLESLFQHLLAAHKDIYFGCKCKTRLLDKVSLANHKKNCELGGGGGGVVGGEKISEKRKISKTSQSKGSNDLKCDNLSDNTVINSTSTAVATTTSATNHHSVIKALPTNAINKKSDRSNVKNSNNKNVVNSNEKRNNHNNNNSNNNNNNNNNYNSNHSNHNNKKSKISNLSSSSSTTSSTSSKTIDEYTIPLTRQKLKDPSITPTKQQQQQQQQASSSQNRTSSNKKVSKNSRSSSSANENKNASSIHHASSSNLSSSSTKVQRTKTTKVISHNSQNNCELVESTLKNEPLNTEFDEDFYKNISHNIRANLSGFIDGKANQLQLSRPVFDRISVSNNSENCTDEIKPTAILNHDEKEIHEATNFELSTPFPALLTVEQYGFGDSNPKNKRQITKNSWKWKWDLIKKYKYVNEGGKIVKKVKQITTGLKDLSQLDMWTQLSMRSRYENLNNQNGTTAVFDDGLNDSLSTRMIKTQNIEQLNTILDKRLMPEINVEQLQQTLVKEEIVEIDECPNDIDDNEEESQPEILKMVNLSKVDTSKVTNPALSGEWARPRRFVCIDCGQEFDLMKSLNDHKNSEHPYVVSAHYEVVGRENLEQKLYKNLFLPKKALHAKGNANAKLLSINSDSKSNEASSSSENSVNSSEQKEKECSKCLKTFKYSNDIDVYRHILDCIEDRVWMQAKRRNKYRRSRRKTKKNNNKKSRLSNDQKKNTSSPFRKEPIEVADNSLSNPPTPTPMPKDVSSKPITTKGKPETYVNDGKTNNDGMNIKSFFRVSKTTPNLPQKIVVQMIEMQQNTHNNSLRQSLRSSAKKMQNSNNPQCSPTKGTSNPDELNNSVESNVIEATGSEIDQLKKEETIKEEGLKDMEDTKISSNISNISTQIVNTDIRPALTALQIPDSDRMKSLSSPTNSSSSSLVSPTSSVPKKKKKLNDCIAMLTCKIQEKLGVNFFENTVPEIFPPETASKKQETHNTTATICTPLPAPFIPIVPSFTPTSIINVKTIPDVPQAAFSMPEQDEVIDLSIKKKPSEDLAVNVIPCKEQIEDNQSTKSKENDNDSIPNCDDIKGESTSVPAEEKQMKESPIEDLEKCNQKNENKSQEDAKKEQVSMPCENENEKSEVNTSEPESLKIEDITESFKISISKDRIPNLDEILENNSVITVNNLKISESERRAFEEQKNRIMQILSKTKKTTPNRKAAKKAPPKKPPARKNAKQQQLKEDAISIENNDKNKEEETKAESVEPLKVPEPIVDISKYDKPIVIESKNDAEKIVVEKELETPKTAAVEIQKSTPEKVIEKPKTKVLYKFPDSSPEREIEKKPQVVEEKPKETIVDATIQNKIEQAIKTTNRIRCRRLSVVVDPIIHLSPFHQSNRKIRLTNNSQQNGLYDLLTNDQLFNAITPQLKDEIKKTCAKVANKAAKNIQNAINEVKAATAKSLKEQSKDKVQPETVVVSNKNVKSKASVKSNNKKTASKKKTKGGKKKANTRSNRTPAKKQPEPKIEKAVTNNKKAPPKSKPPTKQEKVTVPETKPLIQPAKLTAQAPKPIVPEPKAATSEKKTLVTPKKIEPKLDIEEVTPQRVNTLTQKGTSQKSTETSQKPPPAPQKAPTTPQKTPVATQKSTALKNVAVSQPKTAPQPPKKVEKSKPVKIAKKTPVKSKVTKTNSKQKKAQEDVPIVEEILDKENDELEILSDSIDDRLDDKNSFDISSDASNENDIPLAKLISLSKEKSIKEEENQKMQLDDKIQEEPLPIEKTPLRSNCKKKTPTKKASKGKANNKSRSKTRNNNNKNQKTQAQEDEVILIEEKQQTPTEIDVKMEEGRAEISIQEEKMSDMSEKVPIEVAKEYDEKIKIEDEKPKKLAENKSEKIKSTESINSSKTAKVEKENVGKLEVFNINEDSFFNDDNDADEKINDLVNNIINSSELVDSENEKNDQMQQNLNENQTEAKCLICKKNFKNEKVLEKHNTTTTHLFKVKRREKRIADEKERELRKEKEREKMEKDNQKKDNENQVNASSSDETKIFRTKGALKTFENILAYPSNRISETINYEQTKEFNPVLITSSEPKTPLPFDTNKKLDAFEFDDDDSKNEDLSRKDKIFDSLFSNIENKLQAAAAASANSAPAIQKFAFPTLTPHDSEVESSSTSWDLKHDADIEWDADNNEQPSLANVMKEKFPKKNSVKINKSKETAISIPTKSLIMGKIFKKHRDREKQKTPQADAPNNKPGIKNSLDEIFDHLKNSAEIDDKVLTCPSPKTLLKSSGGTFSPHSSHSNDMLETASQSNSNNNNNNNNNTNSSSGNNISSNNINNNNNNNNDNTSSSKNNVYSKKPIYASTPDKTSAASSNEKKASSKKENSELPKKADNATTEEEEDGIGKRKSRRRCAIKTKTFAETWSSDEYEELHDTNDIISIINEIEKRESIKKRKVSKSESHFVDNNVSNNSKKNDHVEPSTASDGHHNLPQKPNASILKSSTESTITTDNKKIIQHNDSSSKNEKKKSVQLQFPTSDIFSKEKPVNTIRKRRMSTLKDGHKSDEETFTATKDLKPLKPTISMMKKRRMSCFVPSSVFNDAPPKPQTNNRTQKSSTSEIVLSNKMKIDKELDHKEGLSDASDKITKNQKKILSAVCNNSNSVLNTTTSATATTTSTTSSANVASTRKKVQKHRKRPRNKIKNIAYDSDSDFELNLGRKSKASAFSDSYSEEEYDGDEISHTSIKPNNATSQNSLTSKSSNTNELTMIKEPKLLPTDLNVVTTTTPAKAAIPEDINDPSQSACNRTKRHSSEKLYYWSSSSSESDAEPGDTADGENEDSMIPQPEQHGWIVGDSHKKLVTLLAHAKIKNKIN